MYSRKYEMRVALHLSGFPPQNPQSKSNREKISDKSHWEAFCRITDKYSSNCQDHQKQGKSKELSQQRGAYEHMETNGNVVSWMGHWNTKRKLNKIKENWLKSGLS